MCRSVEASSRRGSEGETVYTPVCYLGCVHKLYGSPTVPSPIDASFIGPHHASRLARGKPNLSYNLYLALAANTAQSAGARK